MSSQEEYKHIKHCKIGKIFTSKSQTMIQLTRRQQHIQYQAIILVMTEDELPNTIGQPIRTRVVLDTAFAFRRILIIHNGFQKLYSVLGADIL